MKYVILCSNKNKYTFKYMENENVSVFSLYKNSNPSFLKRIIRKIVYFLGFKLNYMFYDEWINYINLDVQFIVFDECKPYFRLLKILKKLNNKAIIYFWNPIKKGKEVSKLKQYFYVFSYSESDALNYCLNYNQTFLPTLKVMNYENKYDAFFVGKNKNRLKILEKIFLMFTNPFFHVIRDGKEKSIYINLKDKNNHLDYDSYLIKLQQSNVLIELIPQKNAGYTLRSLESFYFQKKLITNNSDILNCFLFDKGNILIIDDSLDCKKLDEFIKKDFVYYSKEEISRFSENAWLQRFVDKIKDMEGR